MSTTPALEFVFEIRAHIAEKLHVGHGAGESTEVIPITGGTVAGPRLNATVLPGGADWSSVRGDVSQLEARYLLRADDGAVIDVVNRGYYHPGDEAPDQWDGSLRISEKGHYFRTAPTFRTDAPAHLWLARTVFVGLARAEGDDTIVIRVYALA